MLSLILGVVLAVEGTGTLALAGIGAAIAIAAYTLLSRADEKAVVRASLRRLDGYEVENVRDRELLDPLRIRAIIPTIKRLTEAGRRLTPAGYTQKVRQKFVYAGAVGPDAVDRFLVVRFLTVVAIPVVFVGALLLGITEMPAFLIALLLCAFLLLGPDALLNRRVEDRQNEIRRRLPDVLDLLVISVEAGLGFEQALDRTVAAVPGPLSDEFSRMLGEVRAGASRSDAIRAMEGRTHVPELRSFVLAIIQADTFGVSIGRVLRTQSDEMRIKRRQLAQEQAQKAPVKMLVPMVFCIFPSLFIVVLGPAAINIYDSFILT